MIHRNRCQEFNSRYLQMIEQYTCVVKKLKVYTLTSRDLVGFSFSLPAFTDAQMCAMHFCLLPSQEGKKKCSRRSPNCKHVLRTIDFASEISALSMVCAHAAECSPKLCKEEILSGTPSPFPGRARPPRPPAAGPARVGTFDCLSLIHSVLAKITALGLFVSIFYFERVTESVKLNEFSEKLF
ncbi:hypothetical protein EVAR_50560_1 [Eumeta japonica]|uniref:Uncharacterized protein n=1 Tax=Eumeta variegata TaxID=151549 RepID=A0A4C1ZAI5_EUMVA|nr:hypothetical protein EVAR_50560_1 [Eumeta japonica]